MADDMKPDDKLSALVDAIEDLKRTMQEFADSMNRLAKSLESPHGGSENLSMPVLDALDIMRWFNLRPGANKWSEFIGSSPARAGRMQQLVSARHALVARGVLTRIGAGRTSEWIFDKAMITDEERELIEDDK